VIDPEIRQERGNEVVVEMDDGMGNHVLPITVHLIRRTRSVQQLRNQIKLNISMNRDFEAEFLCPQDIHP
jgi:hypothetical protein